MSRRRPRFSHTTTLALRLETEAQKLRNDVAQLPDGDAREKAAKDLRELETGIRMAEWLTPDNSRKSG